MIARICGVPFAVLLAVPGAIVGYCAGWFIAGFLSGIQIQQKLHGGDTK